MKILDRYIIRIFFGPFFFIFSVLFFIFMVNVIWTQMYLFLGKGLSSYEIGKLFFYLSASVFSMVLPLTILLSSIMTFGSLGEKYELAAMKSAGISLTRIMLPLFFTVGCLAFILFLFQNNITPTFQKKARNMLYNAALSKPALNFTAGHFVYQIPEYAVKFNAISGKNSENIDGVFIRKSTHVFDDQRSIIAKKGKFVEAENKNFLKLILLDGYIYEDLLYLKNREDRLKQPNQIIKFDTMVSYFDISSIITKAMDEERIVDDYHFKTYRNISADIQKSKKENRELFKNMSASLASITNSYLEFIDQKKIKKNIAAQYILDTLRKEKKRDILYSAYRKIEVLKADLKSKKEQISDVIKVYNMMIIYQQRIFSYSVTCIIFFLIGASLGSIIRKGGMGIPVVISIFIFILFFVANITVENFSWKGILDPYWAAWIPNIIFFPFGVWFTYLALTDSQIFDIERYKTLIKPITKRLFSPKEHSRYR